MGIWNNRNSTACYWIYDAKMDNIDKKFALILICHCPLYARLLVLTQPLSRYIILSFLCISRIIYLSYRIEQLRVLFFLPYWFPTACSTATWNTSLTPLFCLAEHSMYCAPIDWATAFAWGLEWSFLFELAYLLKRYRSLALCSKNTDCSSIVS